MAAKNLLDILTRTERSTFTIDGASYEMRDPHELSMAEFHLLSVHGTALTRAGESYAEDPDGAFDKINTSMNALLDLVTPDLPGEIRDKLNPFHVQQLLEVFTALSQTSRSRGERPNRKKLSRASSASTGKAPITG